MTFEYILFANNEINEFFTSSFDSTNISEDEINIYRTHAFKIQAFGRIIKRTYKKSDSKNKAIREIGEALKTSGKFIEDSIGDYLYHFEMKNFAKDSSNLIKAKKDLNKNITLFREHYIIIEENYNKLKDFDIKNLYLKGLIRELKKIQEDIDLINSELLEDGTHELRRKMRWVIMYIIYPKGLFTYKEEEPETTKYTELFKVKRTVPFEISFDIINFLSTEVYGLGKIKDKGLSKNYLKPHNEINSSTEEIILSTKSSLNKLKKHKYLKKLRSELKSYSE